MLKNGNIQYSIQMHDVEVDVEVDFDVTLLMLTHLSPIIALVSLGAGAGAIVLLEVVSVDMIGGGWFVE